MTAEIRPILIPVSAGELLDKISILEIKAERITSPEKLAHVQHELALLRQVRDEAQLTGSSVELLARHLKTINETLWNIEDDIRECERHKDFGEKFVALARDVYTTNDRRSKTKHEINFLTSSGIVEVKSYAQY